MSGSLSIQPFASTNAPGTFSVTSEGYVQGTLQQAPNKLFELAGGVLASTETLPMWGGIGIYEDIPTAGNGATVPADQLGSIVGRATALTGSTGLGGFSLYDQAHHMVIFGQSAPVALPLMSVHYVRLGSGARVCVACDPSLASLQAGNVNQQVSWDFAGQQLMAFQAGWSANTVTAASWANTGGGQLTFTTNTSHGVGVGEWVSISGAAPGGYNGIFKTKSGTTGSTIVTQQQISGAAITDPGTWTAGGALAAGGGALNVKVLRLNPGNSMTVSYNATTGIATWNRSGSTAVILV